MSKAFPQLPDIPTLTAIALDQLPKFDEHYPAHYQAMCACADILAKQSDQTAALIGIGHLAYGWMPTIIKNKIVKVPPTVSEVAAVEDIAEAAQLLEKMSEDPKPQINNSWGGTSKTWHFVKPQIFPIWDSRVALEFGLNSYAKYNKFACYRAYCTWIWENQNDPNVKTFKTAYNTQFDTNISQVRALELILFTK